MKHITQITRTPATASLSISAIITAISSILAVVGQVLGQKESVS